MKNFVFYTPTKVIFGKNEEDNIGKLLKEYGFKKALIHYGLGSVIKSGLLNKIINSMDKNDILHCELGGVEPNPKIELVNQGIDLGRKEEIDVIIALGGGSVIDSSKGIGNGIPYNGDVWDFSIKKAVPEKSIPVIAIPTIAAAGSEMSMSCVLTNGKTKRGFNSNTNQCLATIMNPELTYTLSKYQTACGIVDILMHTLERYYTVEDHTELTDNLSFGLCKSVIEAGKIAINNPTDYDSRATLMFAQSLSHNGLMGVGREVSMPVHQLEHEISGMYPNVAHGAGLAVLFPNWCRYVAAKEPGRFARFAYNVLDVEKTLNLHDAAFSGIKKLEEFFISLGMPSKLRDFNIKKEDIPLLAESYTFFGTRVMYDIVDIGYKEAIEIYNMAY